VSDHRPRPTLEKVAVRAGVSRATVSRVVNGNPNVSESIRSAVMRAVDELGYLPNPAARSLVTRRTDSVALVISEPSARIFSDDPFFAGVIRGVSLELEAAGRQLVLMMTEAGADHARIERYVAGGHVDGVMLVSLHGTDPLPGSLARLGLPVVCGGRPLSRVALPYTDCDNRGGAEAAVRHLIGLGRRRVATIAGPPDMNAGIDRLSGYRAALRGTDRRSLVAVGDFTQDSWVKSPRSPENARCGSCWRTTRRSTRCSWRPTRWRWGRCGRCTGPDGGCPMTLPWSGSTTTTPPGTRCHR
jgi:DNA-binding LacI/PurR family transcriptional regulator